MRDKERIIRIIALLQKVWERYPDLRLGQLMDNFVWKGEDFFYLEDDKLEERIKMWLWEPHQN